MHTNTDVQIAVSVGRLLTFIHHLSVQNAKAKRLNKHGKQERTTDTTILTKEMDKINAY